MTKALYRIVRRKDGWSVHHDNSVSPPYSTREAAFEAAVMPASNAIKAGAAVTIEVEPPAKDEAALA